MCFNYETVFYKRNIFIPLQASYGSTFQPFRKALAENSSVNASLEEGFKGSYTKKLFPGALCDAGGKAYGRSVKKTV